MAELELQAALGKLTDAELLYVRGIAPDTIYQFKHSLIRDAAYEALLKSRRRELHGQVAVAIDENFPVFKEAHPEVLAHHSPITGPTRAKPNTPSPNGKRQAKQQKPATRSVKRSRVIS